MTNAPALTPEQIPPSYARCFQADCPNADTCARFLAGKYIPTGKVWGDAVYPTARQGNTCTMYKQTRVIRAAYGFKALFAEVKQKDDTPLRNRIKAATASRRIWAETPRTTAIITARNCLRPSNRIGLSASSAGRNIRKSCTSTGIGNCMTSARPDYPIRATTFPRLGSLITKAWERRSQGMGT